MVPGFVNSEESELLVELSELFSAEDLQLYYQIALVGQKDLSLAPSPKSGFEMLMLRMLLFKPASNSQKKIATQTNNPAPAIKSKLAATKPSSIASSAVATAVPTEIAPPPIVQDSGQEWSDIVKALHISGLTRELANNCILESLDDKFCKLVLGPKQVRMPRQEEKLEAGIQAYLSKPIKLSIRVDTIYSDTPAVKIQQAKLDRHQDAVNAIETNNQIQALKTNFDARIIPGSIEPVNNKEDSE
jgi:DNA polymerase-3 subunit gamma/tau